MLRKPHDVETVTRYALDTARSFCEPVIVYPAGNGFEITALESWLRAGNDPRNGARPENWLRRVHPDGTIEVLK